MLILTADDIRRALPMRAAIDSQKKAYASLVNGNSVLPLRTPVTVPAQNAVTLFMPARVENDLGAKIVSVFPKNVDRNLPMIHGVVILIDSETGVPLALMDATYLTALRTGAGAGAATELLARPDSSIAAIIGSGTQAKTQLLAICEARPITEARIHSPNAQHVSRFIAEMQPQMKAKLIPASSPRDAIINADIVCAATTSTTPVFDGRDLKPGAHVNGVGAYTLQMKEIDNETIRHAKKVFVDSRETTVAEAGDVMDAIQNNVITENDLIEIGAVASGQVQGRAADGDITFFKSCGIAVQDVAAGGEVLRRARELGLGVEVNL
ncbi:MAG: ornithine cyclodeaminase family protein [Chloroflexi bacterium]|nr:ornithine cyclodeaminase family protein [Chloroflexota bacterium]